MSEQHRGAWGDAMWWPGVVAASTPEQIQHHHLLQQQHMVQQQQQQHEAPSSSSSSQNNQMFSYKMANSFQNPGTTTVPVTRGNPAGYDYRLGGGNATGSPASHQAQWWYPPATVDNSGMHSQNIQQQNQQNLQQQNLPPVQTSPSPEHEIQSRQEDAHRQQEVQRHHQEVQRHQEALQHHHQAIAEAQARHQLQQQQIHNQQIQQHKQIQQQIQRHQLQQNNHHQPQVTPVTQNISKGRMPRAKGDARPRGRMTAYAFFVQTCREEHKKKHPEENVVFAEFSKKCAERWKTMLDKEKKRFHEMAENDKKRYDDEMKNYIPPKGEKQRGKKRKQAKDPNAPKRSLSAFFWFSNDERGKVKGQNPEFGVGDIAKELGRRWADAEPEVKNKYEAMADKDKARYEKEMTAYKKSMQQAAAQPAPRVPENDDIDDDEDDLDDDDDE